MVESNAVLKTVFYLWVRPFVSYWMNETKKSLLRESVAYPVLISAATPTPPPPPRNSAGGRAERRAFDFFVKILPADEELELQNFSNFSLVLKSRLLCQIFLNLWNQNQLQISIYFLISSLFPLEIEKYLFFLKFAQIQTIWEQQVTQVNYKYN